MCAHQLNVEAGRGVNVGHHSVEFQVGARVDWGIELQGALLCWGCLSIPCYWGVEARDKKYYIN